MSDYFKIPPNTLRHLPPTHLKDIFFPHHHLKEHATTYLPTDSSISSTTLAYHSLTKYLLMPLSTPNTTQSTLLQPYKLQTTSLVIISIFISCKTLSPFHSLRGPQIPIIFPLSFKPLTFHDMILGFIKNVCHPSLYLSLHEIDLP
jgi:hypothetical protein